MIKLLIFILAVAVEIYGIWIFKRVKTKTMLTAILINALNVLWSFARVLGLLP